MAKNIKQKTRTTTSTFKLLRASSFPIAELLKAGKGNSTTEHPAVQTTDQPPDNNVSCNIKIYDILNTSYAGSTVCLSMRGHVSTKKKCKEHEKFIFP